VFANLPIGLPYCAAFRPYHLEHHKFLGIDGIDTDLPTRFEALFLQNVLGKAFFWYQFGPPCFPFFSFGGVRGLIGSTFQIFFYAVRPMFVKAQRLTPLHYFNILAQFTVDYILVTTFGWKPFIYLVLSSFLAGSLHPCAGHFIAEHYILSSTSPKPLQRTTTQDGNEVDIPFPEETFSYYGPLNWICYNVGYHNEHHDFPFVPWTRLPQLRELAREFYEGLPCHSSWSFAIWDFIFGVEGRGLWGRVKREGKGIQLE
jgi:sphingolipid delta-4 desaturase